MKSSGSCQPNIPVLSVCPECGCENGSYSNWCIDCGCLLIGNDPPSVEIPVPYYVPHNWQQFNPITPYLFKCYDAIQSTLTQVGETNVVPVRQAIQSARKSVSCASIYEGSTSTEPNDGNVLLGAPLESCKESNTIATNSPYQNSSASSGASHARLTSRQLRQRCISGPSNSLSGVAQGFQNTNYGGTLFFGNVCSESDISETHQSDPHHFHTMSPQFYVPGQCSDNFALYLLDHQYTSQSVDQLAELLAGCNMVDPSQTCGDVLIQYPNGDQLYPHLQHVPRNLQYQSNGECLVQKKTSRFRNRESNKQIRRNQSDNIARQVKQRNLQLPCNVGSFAPKRRKKPQRVSSHVQNTISSLDRKSQVIAHQEPTFAKSLDELEETVQNVSLKRDLSANIEDKDISPCGDDTSHDSVWLRLPTELWYHVVRFLPYTDRASLARTCRRLSVIVADRHNWRVIRLDRYQHLTDSGLAKLGRMQPQQLHLTYCRGDAVTTWGIQQLFGACGASLRHFSFIGCSKGAFQGDLPLLVSASLCPNLSHIDASYAHTVRDQTVRAIAESSVALKSLLLNGAQQISNSAIEHLVRHHKNTLERLELFGCFNLNSKIFATLGECHGLKALAFGFLHHLSSKGLIELVSKLPLLASLDLRGTQKLVTDSSLSRLAKKCPLLEEVVLANMSSLTREEGVITMLHQLPRLRVLDLCGLTVVGDKTLQALAASCPLLEELDISCTSVTEAGLLCLADAPAACLKSLRISFCPQITPVALEKLATSCQK
uniref:F-box domain-containing protein n=1 Tax=Mesocestoides corti TaxID=53468 RepID=A0A5K3F9B1_MESCO